MKTILLRSLLPCLVVVSMTLTGCTGSTEPIAPAKTTPAPDKDAKVPDMKIEVEENP